MKQEGGRGREERLREEGKGKREENVDEENEKGTVTEQGEDILVENAGREGERDE